MDRASVFFLQDNKQKTFEFDDSLPPLPLPELHETLQRYYDSLIPFGTEHELSNTRRIIENFEYGIGRSLQAKLKERSLTMKNWLGDWWDMYAYHTLRIPLYPYTIMLMPLKLEFINIPETPEYALKNLARILYHNLELWDTIRKEKLKPLSTGGGKVKYSSNLYKNFFSTSRISGEEIDSIERHFKTIIEGKTPTHIIISGKGRLFMFNALTADDHIITPQQLLVLLQRIRSILDYEPDGDNVPILTHDERTAWAKNRQYLKELSTYNQHTLQLVESSIIVIVFDENEPKDYQEASQLGIGGDYHSLWADHSTVYIAFKNGKFTCIGEHSSYDGTISTSIATFVQMSLYETPEPDWNEIEEQCIVGGLQELKFELDDYLKKEIARVREDCNERRLDVLVTYDVFEEYGREYMKSCQLHPDSFVQVIIQLAYAEMHKEIAATYETALMRHYYKGRTETLRSCTTEVAKFLETARQPQTSTAQVIQAFRKAIKHHNFMMNEARNGRGVDRHLFGLWCVAHINKMETLELFTDPLYTKSGGGGNFTLSTSTIGNSVNVGFVAPMVLDGYGVFYTFANKSVFMQVTAFRGSMKTSAHKFHQHIFNTFRKIKQLLDEYPEYSDTLMAWRRKIYCQGNDIHLQTSWITI